jgi:type II secretion system protein H
MTMALSRQKRRCGRASGRSGFTLIEIMIVLAIIAIIMSASIPMVWKAMTKDDLARAANDVMEGCKTARDRAILTGAPYEFVISDKGDMNIHAAPQPKPSGPESASGTAAAAPEPTGSLMAGFPRKLGEDVMIQLIDVNFVDHMALPEAHVHFYPNGTSDEFTVVLAWKGAQKTVTLDVVTGLANLLTK